ncbi:DNA repair ATPase [Actinacidiphila alni]|uniref:DNA repair ATPase n=1 Tax=Actinacidiphila alni TaxID=380248 RepID=A0A1I2IUH2_9ACTN|nr:DNA repair ATPase [Actinacidiphila alni]SFF44406.1 DNA repair ATPase [Actinacidiphila alni]
MSGEREPGRAVGNGDGGGDGGGPAAGIDGDAYEVLRARLGAAARLLGERADTLNSRRQEVFGAAELRLDGTERLRTARPAHAADVAAVGPWLLFAANPQEVGSVGDVFQVRPAATVGSGEAGDHAGSGAPDPLPKGGPAGLLDDPAFVREFGELYRYYRETRVLRLRVAEGRLLAVFRTGPGNGDVRAVSWRVAADGSCTYEGTAREEWADADADAGAYEVSWTAATREDQVPGRHPHLALTAADGGTVTVATTGGTLTLATGDTRYEEPVEDALQALADAEVAHATVGPLMLLRIRPYREDTDRHFAVNTRTGEAERLDALGQACLRLPDDQGVVFPGGYALAGGGIRAYETRAYETGPESLEFERIVRSATGEDMLYVFHAAADGRRLLLPYNLIRKEAAAPLHVQGCALYEDGTLLTLRPADGGEPARVHAVQRWSTPFQSDAYAAARPAGGGPLDRIGNPDLVRAVADTLSLARTARALEAAPALPGYEALAVECERVLDRHHWLGDAEVAAQSGDLVPPLTELRDTARQVLAEYARVRELTARAAEAVDEAAARIAAQVRQARGETARSADEWVRRLTELRRSQGRLMSLRELRYADTARLDTLAADLTADLAQAANRAAGYFADAHAFDAYRERVAATAAEAAAIGSAADAAGIGAALDDQAAGLGTVTETVGGLEIADATVRTAILAAVADVLGAVNQARAVLDARRKELAAAESADEFAAESTLLAQSVSGALAAADTPERCEEQLGRLLVAVENLATRFAADEARLAALDARREEIHQTFAARKQALADERAQRAQRLAASAERVLAGVRRRAAELATLDDVNTYFASDPMAAQHRRIAGQLRELGDPARAAEAEAALAAARQDADRSLRDRLDLYEAGGAVIRLGRHKFAVNTQPLDLALVPHDGGLAFTVSGTDYLAPVTDPAFAATRRFWDRPLVSESPDLYRAEYLAATLLLDASGPLDDIPARVADAAAARLDEGYERGVHDHDAVLLLTALHDLDAAAGLLRHPPAARALAQLFWAHGATPSARAAWTTRARSLTRAATAFGRTGQAGAALSALAGLTAEIGAGVRDFAARTGLGDAPGFGGGVGLGGVDLGGSAGSGAAVGADPSGLADAAAGYLVAELAADRPGFVGGAAARALRERFVAALGGPQAVPYKEFLDDLAALGDDLGARWQLTAGWLGTFTSGEPEAPDDGELAEAAASFVRGADLAVYDSDAAVGATVTGLLGTHPRITGRRMAVRLDETLARVRRFRAEEVPAYRTYQRHRTAVVDAERDRLGLAAYRPRPLTGFVRNRLVDEVLLPLIGDNLDRQFGPSGGLLMLMSPPGYGKTSLIQYVAARLGLALVTVDGPALGSGVTSLDPERAPDATSRREVEKINFALELGSNALLHLDDIQHTSPELLQKFITLCDAQRRVEGAAGTYDLRGKRFAVCMAGNPYTESGRLFRVPDMLANRADVWNLGSVLTGREALFALSYIENALTANETLAPLAGRDRADLELLVRLAEDDPTARPDDLTHPYPAAERDAMTTVLRHLLRARATVLAVNAAYIASAGRADADRTEPPFLLQGSYRTMTRLAARIHPTLTTAELDTLIDDHYRTEAQTLAAGAESALRQFAALRAGLRERRE